MTEQVLTVRCKLSPTVDRPGGSEGLPSIKAVLSGLLKAPVFRPE
jgi:hypothetical protein